MGNIDIYLDQIKTFDTYMVVVKYMIIHDATVSNSRLKHSF